MPGFESENKIELIKAVLKASIEGFSGITLINNDPEADYKALVNKNSKILSDNGLSMCEEIEFLADGSTKIKLSLLHGLSGQYINSQITLKKEKYKNALEKNSPEIFIFCRILYEGLLNLASENDSIEASLFVKDKGYMRFSWNDIKLFMQCRRCFYNSKKFKIKINTFDDNAHCLVKVTEMLLKKEFDLCRTNKISHPIMTGIGSVRPLSHKKLDIWRMAYDPENKTFGGVEFKNVWEGWIVYGGVDDLWINKEKEVVVVDYKCTTKNIQKIRISKEHKNQLEFYAWILRKMNYKVSLNAYLLYYSPVQNKNSFEWKLEFQYSLKELQIDDSWVQQTIYEALNLLDSNIIPEAGVFEQRGKKIKCEVCDYFDKLSAEYKKQS